MRLKTIIKYINYWLSFFTEHDLHSPFLYNFYIELVKNEYCFGDFEVLSSIRKKLYSDKTIIKVLDFGAGSKKMKSNERSIRQISKHGIASQKQAEFLYRLVNKFSPKTIVELGTSVGLTTLYLSRANVKSKIYTIEGCPNLFQYSKKQFVSYKAQNIFSINGNFDSEFPKILSKIESLDFLYIDGNHTYSSTINYFNMALGKKNPHSIFVFDDINWNEDMQKAWREICASPEITLSLDFFHFGVVFFRKEQLNKEHFILKF